MIRKKSHIGQKSIGFIFRSNEYRRETHSGQLNPSANIFHPKHEFNII